MFRGLGGRKLVLHSLSDKLYERSRRGRCIASRIDAVLKPFHCLFESTASRERALL